MVSFSNLLIRLVIILTTGVCLVFIGCVSVAMEPTRISPDGHRNVSPLVEAAISNRDGEYFIDFTITNETNQQYEVYQQSLPWEGRYSAILIAVEADASHTQLNTFNPIDDPRRQREVLLPGKKLSGRLSLSKRFPKFSDVI